MKIFKLLNLFVLLILIGACSTIKTINQLGEKTYLLDKNKWEGTWVTGEGFLQLKVIDIETSEVSIMLIEKGELQKYKIFIRKNGEDSYMNLVDEDNHYLFAKFKRTRNQIIVWLPSREMMQKAINSKALTGVISEKKNVLITSEKKQVNNYFVENKDKILFEYEEPIIFRKLIK
jgi:uncharacterized protein YcfL